MATLLVDLEAAVRQRDASAAEKLADPGDTGARELLRAMVDNAEQLRVADFSLRYVDEDRALSAGLDGGRWAAAVDTSWRFDGFDAEPAHTEVTFRFGEENGRAVLVGVGGDDRRTPLWLTGPLRVERTDTTLVLVDGSQEKLERYSRLAQGAVPVVLEVLSRWQPRLVVEVPASAAAVDEVLGVEPGQYAAIAAVTTTVDGSLSPTAPVHVFVNPEVFGDLREVGGQVVMSHEATHVATDAATSSSPVWLLEGFADYVALRDVPLPLSVTAGQVLEQVRDEGPPAALPGRAEFDTRTTHLGAAYEAAWLACRLLADLGGEQALVELYRRTSEGAQVDAAMRAVFSLTLEQFTARWSQHLQALAR